MRPRCVNAAAPQCLSRQFIGRHYGNRRIPSARQYQGRIRRLRALRMDRADIGPLGRYAAQKQQRVNQRWSHVRTQRAPLLVPFQARGPRLTDPDAALLDGQVDPQGQARIHASRRRRQTGEILPSRAGEVMVSHMDQVVCDGGGVLQDELGLCFSKVTMASR